MGNNIKVLFFGNILYHGVMAAEWATGFLLASSLLENVEQIDIVCPRYNEESEIVYPDKVKIKNTFNNNSTRSIFAALRSIEFDQYDLIVFNTNPTYLGLSKLSNFIGQVIPIILKWTCRTRVVVIRHSSTFTNDVKNLGFNTFYDIIKSVMLKVTETVLFVNVDTYFLLNSYTEKVKKSLRKAKVHYFKNEYLEALPTLFLNGYLINNSSLKSISIAPNSQVPTILMHGFWGPQKNIIEMMQILKQIFVKGLKFKLIISGDVNPSFPSYSKKFSKVIKDNSEMITEYLGYVNEKNIFSVFSRSNLVLLPYVASGGHSGVIEVSTAFNLDVFVTEHHEYLEIASLKGDDKIRVIKLVKFKDAIEGYIETFTPETNDTEIEKKIEIAIVEVDSFYKDALHV